MLLEALKELTTSPVYRNLLVSDEGDLTAVQVVIAGDEEAAALLEPVRLPSSSMKAVRTCTTIAYAIMAVLADAGIFAVRSCAAPIT